MRRAASGIGSRIAIALLAAVAVPLSAATSSVRVTATVAPFLLQRIEGIPESIAVTASDVAAGYVDVDGIRVVVKTNDPIGYVIAFRPRSSDFERIDVGGFGEPVHVGRSGGVVVRRLERVAFVTFDLSFRIAVPSNAQPGTYAFPVDVTAYRLSP